STTQPSPEVASRISAWNSPTSAMVQFARQLSASSSTNGTPRISASARPNVVLPLHESPTTETRRTSRRYPRSARMKLHEYQAKQLLARAGITIPEGRVATTPEEAEAAARALGGTVVVKAQVHAGGRGKAGGIKVAKTTNEARDAAAAILHM